MRRLLRLLGGFASRARQLARQCPDLRQFDSRLARGGVLTTVASHIEPVHHVNDVCLHGLAAEELGVPARVDTHQHKRERLVRGRVQIPLVVQSNQAHIAAATAAIGSV